MPFMPQDGEAYPKGPASTPADVGENPAKLKDAAGSAAEALTTLIAGLGNLGFDDQSLKELRHTADLARRVEAKLTPKVGDAQRDELRVTLIPANMKEAAAALSRDVHKGVGYEHGS